MNQIDGGAGFTHSANGWIVAGLTRSAKECAMASHVPPSRTRESKVSDRARTRPAQTQGPRCLGAAAQLAAVHRTLRGGLIERRATDGAAADRPAGGIPDRIAKGAATPPGTPNRTDLPDRLKAGVEALSGLAMDDVHVHRNSSEPARLGALAYAQGSDIHLGPGQEQHLPHETWHVVQQKQGRVKPTATVPAAAIQSGGIPSIQMVRTPAGEDLGHALPIAAAAPAGMRGMARVLSRAWAALPKDKQLIVWSEAPFGLEWTDETQMRLKLERASGATISALAEVITRVEPDATLGDQTLFDLPPREGTLDRSNLETLVTNVQAIFTEIIGNKRDADLGQVFGKDNVAAAKAKYKKAADFLDILYKDDRILTDRTGFGEAVGVAGQAVPGQCIRLPAQLVDEPTFSETEIMLIHESLHAANPDVVDKGYTHQEFFTERSEEDKLTNAAHYEIVPRRMESAAYAFSGPAFKPREDVGPAAGSSGSGDPDLQGQARDKVSALFSRASAVAVERHQQIRYLYTRPEHWPKMTKAVMEWSREEGLTIHDRASAINPKANAPAERPVTVIDIALSEGLCRKLTRGMHLVPQVAAESEEFSSTRSGLDQLLLMLVLGRLGELIGPQQDFDLVRRLGGGK